jgi:hypothetical protein
MGWRDSGGPDSEHGTNAGKKSPVPALHLTGVVQHPSSGLMGFDATFGFAWPGQLCKLAIPMKNREDF